MGLWALTLRRRKFENGVVALNTHKLFSVHTTPEKFENGVVALNTHKMFSVHTTPEKFESGTITGRFGFVFEKDSGREII